MAALIGILLPILGIVSIVCWIITLIEMFKESVVQGIIGIICGLWALIWGWQHRDRGILGKVVPLWTLVIIISIVLQIVMVAVIGAGAANP